MGCGLLVTGVGRGHIVTVIHIVTLIRPGCRNGHHDLMVTAPRSVFMADDEVESLNRRLDTTERPKANDVRTIVVGTDQPTVHSLAIGPGSTVGRPQLGWW